MCELTIAVTTSRKEIHKNVLAKNIIREACKVSLRSAGGKREGSKQKPFTNNYSCWTNSVRHIYNKDKKTSLERVIQGSNEI
jgi:hypothetical protein